MRYFHRALQRDATRITSPLLVWAIFAVLALLLGWFIHSAVQHAGSTSGWAPGNARTEQKSPR